MTSDPASVAAEALLRANEALALSVDTNAKVSALHRLLMEPQPGHEKSLIERVAAVTIAAETGTAAGDKIVRWAKIIAAIGTVCAAIVAALRFGTDLKG